MFIYVCMCVYVCMCIYLCTCVCLYVCICMYMCLYMCVYMYVQEFVYVYVCMCVPMQMIYVCGLVQQGLLGSQQHHFEIQAYRVQSAPEELRPPRVVRIAGVQAPASLAQHLPSTGQACF